MSSPTPSNISQHNADMLKEQCHKIQQHYEEQQFLVQLEKTVEACCVEHVAQKARREAEAKAKKEAKRRRIAEKEEKKKTLEYIQ